MQMQKGADTMSKMSLLFAAALILGGSAVALRAEAPAGGQSEEATQEILISTIRANRKAMVAVNLQLTDDEAVKFWPVYDRYQKESNAVGDRLVALVEDYTASFADMSNDKAMKIVEDYLAIEADRVEVRRSYVDEFSKSLPGRKVARFYQIENKMNAVLLYDLAATIPVID